MSRLSIRSALAFMVAVVLAFGGLSPAQAATRSANLALGADVSASSTHPHDNYALNGSHLVDGATSTRWASADDAVFPLTIDLDFGEDIEFDELYIDEYTDAGTNPRVHEYALQRWDAESSSWVTFGEYADGIGRDKRITGFGVVTSSKLRLSITATFASEQYTPTLTEIQVYLAGDDETEPGEGAPPANDDPYFGFESRPVAEVEVGADARVVPFSPAPMSGSTSRRAVVSGDDVLLQTVVKDSGEVTDSLDVSDLIDEVTFVTSAVDDSSRLVMYLAGENDDVPVLVRVTSPDAATMGTPETVDAETLDAAAFSERTGGIELADLELLSPFSSGLLAIYDDGTAFTGKRVDVTLAPQEGRDPISIPFSYEDRTFYLDDYSYLYSGRQNGIDKVSLYDLGSVTSMAVEGLGAITSWVIPNLNTILAADDAGRIAAINLRTGVAQAALIETGSPVDSFAFASYLSDIYVASAGDPTIRRYALSGETRTPLDAPGGVLAGSLNSTIEWTPGITFLAAIDDSVYAYRTHYLSTPTPWFTPALSVGERGGGVDFSLSASGTALNSSSNLWFEYSLDGGASWAKRGESWATAVADKGNVTIEAEELPDAMDGIAPYSRQEVGENVWSNTTIGLFYGSVTLPAEQYDALWRYRVESVYGSFATAASRIVIESEQEVDPALRVTAQPSPVRVTAGQSAVFTASADAGEAPSTQWQRSTDGETWEDIDGATSTELRFTTTTDDLGSRYRAVFSSGASEVTTDAATLELMVPAGISIGAAPDGAVVATGATFPLDLSAYSHEWGRDVAGENVAQGETGFVFGSGTGWTHPVTGETQLTWEGTAVYLPYGGGWGLYQSYANPYLSIAADGRATLTAEVAWNNGGGVWSGAVDSSYTRVIVQTYASGELTQNADGTYAFSGTPEWDGRAYSAGAGTPHPDSFPASFLDYLHADNRSWFFASGSTRDPEKAPLPVTVTFDATTEAASTSGDPVDATDPLGDGKNPFTPTSPTVTSQPASVTIAAGSAATLTASASGSPVPTVQWQRLVDGVWTDIPGATSTAYEATGLAEGEHSFRAVFTGGGAVAESEAAVVTVSQEAVEPEPGDGPVLTVAPSEELEDGGTVSVSGAGFEKNTNGNGVYVLFGYATELPSEGGRVGEAYDYLPGEENQRFIAWPDASTASAAHAFFEDGAFSVDGVTVRSSFVGQSGEIVDCLAVGVTCGVFTIGAHGAADAALETFTPVSFATADDADGGDTDGGDADGGDVDGGDVDGGDVDGGDVDGGDADGGDTDGTDGGDADGTDTDGTTGPGSGRAPSEADLVADLEGGIAVPLTAEEGSVVTVFIGAGRSGQSVSAYLFSDALSLGAHLVSATGEIQVQLPDGVTGQHRLAVYDDQGQIIGWGYITISSDAASDSRGATVSGALAGTGGEIPFGVLVASLALLAWGVTIVMRRRRTSDV